MSSTQSRCLCNRRKFQGIYGAEGMVIGHSRSAGSVLWGAEGGPRGRVMFNNVMDSSVVLLETTASASIDKLAPRRLLGNTGGSGMGGGGVGEIPQTL